MRKWTKSACVVIAWSILPVVLIGTRGPDRPAQASTTNASSISKATLTDAPGTLTTSNAAAPATAVPTATWVVRPGDTLSTIASALRIPGGWQALYAANRRLIGPDPNNISAGTRLTLPGLGRQTQYTVNAGDTLSGIASALRVSGGWQALYAANRRLIGPNPDAISAGTTLTVPGPATRQSGTGNPATSKPATGKPTTGKPATGQSATGKPASGQPATSPPITSRHRISSTQTVPAANPPQSGSVTSDGVMPNWLKLTLLVAALLTTLAFITEPVAALARRRRRAVRPTRVPPTAGSREATGTRPDGPGPRETPAGKPEARPPADPGTGPSRPARGTSTTDASPAAPGRTGATPAEALPADTGPVATGPADTRPADTRPADTASADAALANTETAAALGGALGATAGRPATPARADGSAADPGGADEAATAQPRAPRLRAVRDVPDGPGTAHGPGPAPGAQADRHERDTRDREEEDPGESVAEQAARIVQAEHERLVVTYSVRDHTVYLLTPPGEDPRTVLRAARLVVPEHTYQELAGHLGITPGWRLL